jgi:hypothetical protein
VIRGLGAFQIDGVKQLNIDPVNLALRSATEGAPKILNELETELAEANARHGKILADMAKVNDASFAGDQRARMELPGLNKQDVETGRLIRSIEHQVKEAKKRVAMAENQAAMAARRVELDDGALVRDKWFAVKCPDGRDVRHRHHSLEALQKELQPNYRAIGQVFGANEDGTGGFLADPRSDMMQALLDAYGNTLLAWLAERGITVSDKTVIVLPSNGR